MNLEERIQISESIRQKLTHRVASLVPELQNHRPNPGDFSAIEMLEHMALVEMLNASFIEPSIKSKAVQKAPKPNFIYRFVMKGMGKGKRVPTDKKFIPTSDPTLESAMAKWEAARGKILQHLRASEANPTAIKHQFFGRLSAFQLLDLLDKHCEYHNHFFPIDQ